MEKQILNRIAQAIFDKKGMNILALDLRFSPTIADYVVIAEGSADRHVIALAEYIIKELEQEGVSLSFQQGMQTGDWVVLDYSWVSLHLFMPGIRDRYNLENLWPKADIVDLEIDVSGRSLLASGQ